MEKRKHPVCEIKGCDLLQAAAVTLDGRVDAYSGDAEGDGPFEAKVCLKHARQIEGRLEISVGEEK